MSRVGLRSQVAPVQFGPQSAGFQAAHVQQIFHQAAQAACGQQDFPIPVSYTHPDVYKRQCFRKVGEQDGEPEPECDLQGKAERLPGVGIPYNDCLLYTSFRAEVAAQGFHRLGFPLFRVGFIEDVLAADVGCIYP